jgi:hypothetical protein
MPPNRTRAASILEMRRLIGWRGGWPKAAFQNAGHRPDAPRPEVLKRCLAIPGKETLLFDGGGKGPVPPFFGQAL